VSGDGRPRPRGDAPRQARLAISVPAGFSADGLPMGLQLIGRPLGDLALLQLAARYEETIAELLARRPPLPASHA
jgi:Asp-tRNA(Asn)/Glu-tRNA(Gln) amidotransferase A subunit family amidase